MSNTLNRAGFTLIEIMVVITIISILTSVLYVSFNAARENSRDQVRKTDMKQLQLAIELYKAQNGSYPASGCGSATNAFYGPGPAQSGSVPSGNYFNCDTDWIVGLVPEFISELPLDPTSEDEPGQGFYYRSNGASYKILVKDSVERNFITSFNQEFARCPQGASSANFCNATSDLASGSDDSYALYSFDAEDW